jgi:hypothetical protein
VRSALDWWNLHRVRIIGTSRSTRGIPAAFALALLLSAGTVGTSISGPVSETEKNPSTVLDVWVSRGELTVDVRNAPLAEVLRTVGEKAGVGVTLRGDLDTPVTESFAGVPLEEGIRRLARGHSVAATYAASADAPRRGVLTGVWVIGGSATPGPSVAARSTRGDPSAPPSQGARDSSAPGPSSLRDQKADERVPDVTVHFPVGGWIDGIQALSDEAVRGSEAAVALLADISASEPAAVVRHQAVAALGRLKGPAIELALTAALADDDVAVRVRAVRGLRAAGTETAVQSLAGILMRDGEPPVRLAALGALTSLPGPTMLQGLAKASSDPDALVREAAAQGFLWWKTRLPGAR